MTIRDDIVIRVLEPVTAGVGDEAESHNRLAIDYIDGHPHQVVELARSHR